MMGRSHMATGWIGGAGVATVINHGDYPQRIWVGVMAMVLVLWPDNDHPNSKWTKALPPLTTTMCRLIRGMSRIAYRATATAKDKKSTGTHRYLTHTNAWAMVTGATTGLLSARYGGLPLGSAAALAGVAWLACVIHCMGDDMTEHGCPFWWPIKINGQRWYMTHLLPAKMRLTTGTTEETDLFTWWLMPISVLLIPGVEPRLAEVAAAGWLWISPALPQVWTAITARV